MPAPFFYTYRCTRLDKQFNKSAQSKSFVYTYVLVRYNQMKRVVLTIKKSLKPEKRKT